jgi:preprotein translocase subunit SecG
VIVMLIVIVIVMVLVMVMVVLMDSGGDGDGDGDFGVYSDGPSSRRGLGGSTLTLYSLTWLQAIEQTRLRNTQEKPHT